jgi:hypothetical protein
MTQIPTAYRDAIVGVAQLFAAVDAATARLAAATKSQAEAKSTYDQVEAIAQMRLAAYNQKSDEVVSAELALEQANLAAINAAPGVAAAAQAASMPVST